MNEPTTKASLKGIQARVRKARDFPSNTCPASRHALMIADALASGKPYAMLSEEPRHCARSIYAVIASLWELRSSHPTYKADVQRRVDAVRSEADRG